MIREFVYFRSKSCWLWMVSLLFLFLWFVWVLKWWLLRVIGFWVIGLMVWSVWILRILLRMLRWICMFFWVMFVRVWLLVFFVRVMKVIFELLMGSWFSIKFILLVVWVFVLLLKVLMWCGWWIWNFMVLVLIMFFLFVKLWVLLVREVMLLRWIECLWF